MATYAYFNSEGSTDTTPPLSISRFPLPPGTLALAARVPATTMREIANLAVSSPQEALRQCEEALDAIGDDDAPAENHSFPVLKQLLGPIKAKCSFSSGSVLFDVAGPTAKFGKQLEEDPEIAVYLGLSCQIVARRTLQSSSHLPSVEMATVVVGNTLLSTPQAKKLVCAHSAQPNVVTPLPQPTLPHGGEAMTFVSVMQYITPTTGTLGKSLCNQFWRAYERLQIIGGFRRGAGYLLFASAGCDVLLSTADDKGRIIPALSPVMQYLEFQQVSQSSTFTSTTSPGVFILVTPDYEQHCEVLPSVRAFLGRSLPQPPRMITTAAAIAHPDTLRACISNDAWASLPAQFLVEGPVRALDAAALKHASTTAVGLLQGIGLEENRATQFFFEAARCMDQGEGIPGQCALSLAQDAVRKLCWSEVALDANLADGLGVGQEKSYKTDNDGKLGGREVHVRLVAKENFVAESTTVPLLGSSTSEDSKDFVRLYHGTSEIIAEQVLQDGFDLELGSQCCNLGRAVYLTDSADCAATYAMYRAEKSNPPCHAALIVLDIPRELFIDLMEDHTLDLRPTDQLAAWRVIVRMHANGQSGHRLYRNRRQLVTKNALIVGPVSKSISSGTEPDVAPNVTQWAFRVSSSYNGVAELHRRATFSVVLC